MAKSKTKIDYIAELNALIEARTAKLTVKQLRKLIAKYE
tara:strand:- start:237 stop:353 length:117 start_codon:yes stop_codon:yes gene_type:complete